MAGDTQKTFSGMDAASKLASAKRRLADAASSDSRFQEEAKEDFAFYDGTGQWSDSDRRILESEGRPCLTINHVHKFVSLVKGLSDMNLPRVVASPVEPGDGYLAEVLNKIMEWLDDNSGDESESAFVSAVVCGRGYVMPDFVPDPEHVGEISILEASVPVHEVFVDPSSRKSDLSDAQWIIVEKWVSLDKFRMMFPDHANDAEELLRTGYHQKDYSYFREHDDMPDLVRDTDYDMPLDTNYYDRAKSLVRVCQMEYREPFLRHHVFNPSKNEWEEFDPESRDKIKAVFAALGFPFRETKAWDERIGWFQFTGDKVLYDGVSPLVHRGFSVVPCVTYRDESQKTRNHFGLVRMIRDPQREINKRWSQALNLLAKQVQPGLLAEEGAVLNKDQFEDAMYKPGAVAWLAGGGLAQVREREIPRFPDAPMRMEELSQAAMKQITGVNPDLLGLDSGRQEPGVVVRLRQQQGVTILKPLLNARIRMMKELFKIRASIVTKYMPDSQILRILGGSEKFSIQDGVVFDMENGLSAPLRDVRNLRYNIKADEESGSMTRRMITLATLMEMQTAGFPVDPKVVIGMLEIPETVRAKWLSWIAEQEQAQAAQAQQAMDQERGLAEQGFALQKERQDGDAAIKAAKADAQREKDMARMEMDRERAGMDFAARMAAVNVQAEQAAAQNRQAERQAGRSEQ